MAEESRHGRYVTCGFCGGAGVVGFTMGHEIKCDRCGGTGRVWQEDEAPPGADSLAADPLVEITKDSWDLVVGRSPLPVLVDFGAPWCHYCRQLHPLVERVAGKTLGQAVVGTVDTDREKGLARKYRVRGIPQVIVFVKGEVAERLPSGVVSEEDMLACLGRMALRKENNEYTLLDSTIPTEQIE